MPPLATASDVDLEYSGCATDFVASHQQRFAVGAFAGRDKNQALGTEVAHSLGCDICNVEVTIVEIRLEFHVERVGDVIHHDTAYAFHADEGIHTSLDTAEGNTFRLRALVIRAVVEGVVFVVGAVEVGSVLCCDDIFKVRSRVI